MEIECDEQPEMIRCTTMRWRPIAIISLFALGIDAGVVWIGWLIWNTHVLK